MSEKTKHVSLLIALLLGALLAPGIVEVLFDALDPVQPVSCADKAMKASKDAGRIVMPSCP